MPVLFKKNLQQSILSLRKKKKSIQQTKIELFFFIYIIFFIETPPSHDRMKELGTLLAFVPVKKTLHTEKGTLLELKEGELTKTIYIRGLFRQHKSKAPQNVFEGIYLGIFPLVKKMYALCYPTLVRQHLSSQCFFIFLFLFLYSAPLSMSFSTPLNCPLLFITSREHMNTEHFYICFLSSSLSSSIYNIKQVMSIYIY